MQFRTEIPIPKSSHPIGYDAAVVSLGSCFAVNMAEKLAYFKFQHSVNPFGILFHPKAIEKFIGFAVSGKEFTGTDVFFHNERWHSFDAHSDLSDSDKETLLQNLNAMARLANDRIAKASHIMITYGTSWVYRENTSSEIVANCHKLPQSNFRKEILSVESIRDSIQNTVSEIRKINAKVQIIFTVSPVRHIKDGFLENQWSKANLISAIHSATSNPPSVYFPSYEIMMDELRDYRFYAEDMIHPNQVAIDYIWKRFSETWISEAAFEVMEKIETIRKGLSHRPFNPDSESHLKFLSGLQSAIARLEAEFPHLHF